MSGSNFVVLPVSDDGLQRPTQETAEIASTVQHALYERKHPEPENPGPLKQILAHQDSLYRYINWEDPVRTLSVYVGAICVLFGTHYLPLTQVALKTGMTTLGVVSGTEFASRSFSNNSLSARLRPKEYKVIPERTLNATLKDLHDFIQYSVVQAQAIVFGQDLNKTFAAFLGFTTLYWLTVMVSPFWVAVVILTLAFLAPLASSIQGRRAARNASLRAQDLANLAAEQGKSLAHDGKVKATELSSRGEQAAADLSDQARDTASNVSTTAANLSSRGQQTASDLTEQAKSTAYDLSSRGQHTAADLSKQAAGTASKVSATATKLSSKGRQTAADSAEQARNTASDISATATETVSTLPRKATSALKETPGYMSSALGNTKEDVNSVTSNHNSGHPNGNPFVADEAPKKVSYLPQTTGGTAKQVVPEVHTSRHLEQDYQQKPVSFVPVQTGGATTSSVSATDLKLAAARELAAAHNALERPHATA